MVFSKIVKGSLKKVSHEHGNENFLSATIEAVQFLIQKIILLI